MAIEDDLRKLAEEQRTLPARRNALVAQAREEGMTWRTIAAHLGMTEFGLRRALVKAQAQEAP